MNISRAYGVAGSRLHPMLVFVYSKQHDDGSPGFERQLGVLHGVVVEFRIDEQIDGESQQIRFQFQCPSTFGSLGEIHPFDFP